jgi:hypothetical protein
MKWFIALSYLDYLFALHLFQGFLCKVVGSFGNNRNLTFCLLFIIYFVLLFDWLFDHLLFHLRLYLLTLVFRLYILFLECDVRHTFYWSIIRYLLSRWNIFFLRWFWFRFYRRLIFCVVITLYYLLWIVFCTFFRLFITKDIFDADTFDVWINWGVLFTNIIYLSSFNTFLSF